METQEGQVRVCARAGLAPKGSRVPSARGCPQKGGGWREDDWHPLSVSAALVTKWDRILARDVSVVWLWGWNSKSENGKNVCDPLRFMSTPVPPTWAMHTLEYEEQDPLLWGQAVCVQTGQRYWGAGIHLVHLECLWLEILLQKVASATGTQHFQVILL